MSGRRPTLYVVKVHDVGEHALMASVSIGDFGEAVVTYGPAWEGPQLLERWLIDGKGGRVTSLADAARVIEACRVEWGNSSRVFTTMDPAEAGSDTNAYQPGGFATGRRPGRGTGSEN